DNELLLLRQRLFGERLANTAVCPQCSERTEWENPVGELMAGQPGPGQIDGDHEILVDDYRIYFRLPASKDLARIDPEQEPDSAVAMLLEGCISRALFRAEPCELDELPKEVIDAVGRRIDELDPQAHMDIRLTCPSCAHEWPVVFDAGRFLWAEISDWAERMLLAVHELASAYHWQEADILALSPMRRQLYLGMVR
ncbi:MAG: hypothetical protein RQ826_11015, partial [Xanthomonadales bacterium]|nr:hypothetical protein [Xanthomonadales bacterium]